MIQKTNICDTCKGSNMKRYSIQDVVKTQKQAKFVERLIEQGHADPEIKRILITNHETIEETKRRVLGNKYKITTR